MELRESVIKTIAFFDLFDFPLTRAEVWRWLFVEPSGEKQACDLTHVDGEISAQIDLGKLKEENGLVSFADRTNLAALRASNYRHSVRKWRRARRWAKVFAAFPGVELVGVANTLAFHGAKDSSDIDFFIVTAPGALWRTRLLCAALSALFWLRPKVNETRDKLCLSFFVTNEALDLSSCCLSNSAPDIYLMYWVVQMTPLVGSMVSVEKFWQANAWARNFFPNALIKHPQTAASWCCWPLAFFPGNFLKSYQMRKLPAPLREGQSRHDKSVVISDQTLKFHLNDRRAEIEAKWQNRVAAYLT